jgi:hypothetical protein
MEGFGNAPFGPVTSEGKRRIRDHADGEAECGRVQVFGLSSSERRARAIGAVGFHVAVELGGDDKALGSPPRSRIFADTPAAPKP